MCMVMVIIFVLYTLRYVEAGPFPRDDGEGAPIFLWQVPLSDDFENQECRAHPRSSSLTLFYLSVVCIHLMTSNYSQDLGTP